MSRRAWLAALVAVLLEGVVVLALIVACTDHAGG